MSIFSVEARREDREKIRRLAELVEAYADFLPEDVAIVLKKRVKEILEKE